MGAPEGTEGKGYYGGSNTVSGWSTHAYSFNWPLASSRGLVGRLLHDYLEGRYVSFVGFFVTQALRVHLRFPNAVRVVPASLRAMDPSWSSKVNDIEEIWPSMNVFGLRNQLGNCRIVRRA